MNDLEQGFINNMGNMEYSQFLTSQLLRDIIDEYNEMAYDELFEISIRIYSDFEKTGYNSPEIPLYTAICDYIKENKNNLIIKAKKETSI